MLLGEGVVGSDVGALSLADVLSLKLPLDLAMTILCFKQSCQMLTLWPGVP